MVDRDGDGTIEAHEIAMQTIENVSLRLQAFLAAIAHESIMGTALRFMLLFIPWPFYIAVFQVRRVHTREEQTRHNHKRNKHTAQSHDHSVHVHADRMCHTL